MRTPPWRALRSSDVEERSGWYVTIILISPGMLLSAYFYGDHDLWRNIALTQRIPSGYAVLDGQPMAFESTMLNLRLEASPTRSFDVVLNYPGLITIQPLQWSPYNILSDGR